MFSVWSGPLSSHIRGQGWPLKAAVPDLLPHGGLPSGGLDPLGDSVAQRLLIGRKQVLL